MKNEPMSKEQAKALFSNVKTAGELGWFSAPPEKNLLKEGISGIEGGAEIFRKYGKRRLDSVLWRVCDGLGLLLVHLVEHGEHESKRYSTGRGFSIEMSEEQFAEALANRAGAE
jgi:hypothetical protein